MSCVSLQSNIKLFTDRYCVTYLIQTLVGLKKASILVRCRYFIAYKNVFGERRGVLTRDGSPHFRGVLPLNSLLNIYLPPSFSFACATSDCSWILHTNQSRGSSDVISNQWDSVQRSEGVKMINCKHPMCSSARCPAHFRCGHGQRIVLQWQDQQASEGLQME